MAAISNMLTIPATSTRLERSDRSQSDISNGPSAKTRPGRGIPYHGEREGLCITDLSNLARRFSLSKSSLLSTSVNGRDMVLSLTSWISAPQASLPRCPTGRKPASKCLLEDV
jgi:hypothetical protein